MWSLLTNFIYHLSAQIKFCVDAVYEYCSNILLFLFLLSGLHIQSLFFDVAEEILLMKS